MPQSSRATCRAKEIGVDWAAALKSVVDNARRQAESWGAVVVAVTPDAPGSAGPAMTAASKLNLLPHAARQDDAWWRRWQLWAPLAALGAAALLAVALPIWQKRDYAIALSRARRPGARAQADASSALRAEARAAGRRLQLRAGQEIRVSERRRRSSTT